MSSRNSPTPMITPSGRRGGRGPGNMDYRKPKNARDTLIRLASYMGRDVFLLFLVLLMMALSSLMGLLASYLLKPIIDECIIPNIGAEPQNWIPLLQTLGKLAIVYAFSVIASYGQSVLMMVLSHKAINRIRADMFSSLQDMPLSYFDAHGNGEIMSRFTNDADSIQTAMEQTFTSFLSAIITFIGTVVMMIRLNFKLFGITFIFIIIAISTSLSMRRKSRILFREQQKNLGIVNDYIEEIVNGIRVVKAFGYEERAKAEFSERSMAFRESARAANSLGMSLMPTINQLMGICYAITTVVGAHFILSGEVIGGTPFTIGSLGVFLTYTRQIRQPINNATSQMVTLLSALAGAERIFNVMDNPPETDNGTVALEPRHGSYAWVSSSGITIPLQGRITLQNVTFSYKEGNPVIRNVSLDIQPGQKVAFVGSTGAGKTTITNLINRFYDIQEGTIFYDGIDIRNIAKDSLRHSMAVILQDTHLFTGSIMENIRYGRLDATDEECIEAAKTANAYDFIMALSDGFQTIITADGSGLSQGQRQLLNISRAVLSRRPVLIMDEATSSIDTRTERLIDEGMNRLMDGKTVLMIAHRLSTIRNADRIAVVEGGEIIEFGNHKELLAQKGRYYELYTGQYAAE